MYQQPESGSQSVVLAMKCSCVAMPRKSTLTSEDFYGAYEAGQGLGNDAGAAGVGFALRWPSTAFKHHGFGCHGLLEDCCLVPGVVYFIVGWRVYVLLGIGC